MPDFGGAEVDLDTFRTEARDWLKANFPPALKGRGGLMAQEGVTPQGGDYEAWRKAMGEKGWGVPTWPTQYGGGGLTPQHARVLQQEMGKIGAWNPIGGMGVMMFGPTLLEYGNDEQKRRHIPSIVKAEQRWCQGFSEPGAGSDLASLQTRCEDKGDHYLINGQKIWTSGAQWADWCFCLVRTDTTKKHEGISFILIDMRTPGVETRPIRLISGNSPFCETFFTDVKVPKENLVGPLGGGWSIAKRLLQHERSGLTGGGGFGAPRQTLPDLAKSYVGADAQGRIEDTELRLRITQNEMESRAFQLTALRSMAESKSNQGPTAATSIMKNAGTKIYQDRAELTLELMGSKGLGWEGEGFTSDELQAVRGWLGGKATTIYGGSFEVQNNIISKRILGLPDPLSNS
ncbi:MAG TPA: acyl-CoA dehydrogenase family protein [Caulobacteraceae bacterium]|jgi:alkylation response protein AidB-like acyl-CoA dehydrogenase|nr:acyl-CoA dehydrogenase family protein [Caulobacteraceae bacterium]